MFNLIKIENSRMNVPEPEYHVCGAELGSGAALTLSEGVLVLTAGELKPTYISLAAGTAGEEIPVVRVEANQIYEVPLSAAITASAPIYVGDKLTVADTGTEVTATKTNGVVTVVALDGASAVGDKIRVRIV